MKRPLLLACCVIACAPLWAQTAGGQAAWFTITGNAQEADADTILVDPRPIAVEGDLRRMKVRMNRSKLRTNPRSVTYRSYEAEVEINCADRNARFTSTQYFDGPLWTRPSLQLVPPPGVVVPMEFRLFEPNPRERVINAACAIGRR